RRVGSAPGLRELVTRYTGWHVQVAEFAQQIWRSNRPPALSVFAVVERDGQLRATDDAAPALGFGAGNQEAHGSAGTSAELISTGAEPFALGPAMRLAIGVDGRLPFSVVFDAQSFADIENATAAEVAGAINSVTTELTARALPTGQLALVAHSVGPSSALAIAARRASWVTLESAPRGRLALFRHAADGRARLFYETYDPETPRVDLAATQALAGVSAPRPAVVRDAAPLGRIRYKTRRGALWGESLPLDEFEASAQGSPAACELADGRVFVAWVAAPFTAGGRLRFRVGVPRAPTHARLLGRRAGPFAVHPGMRLLFRGDFAAPEVVEFAALDFAAPGVATATEIALAVNNRSTQVTATVLPDGTLELRRASTSGDAWLELDLRLSNASGALGFDDENHAALGDWGDAIDWDAAGDVPVAPGWHSDLHAVLDAAGGVWLFWSRRGERYLQIVSARWDSASWSALEVLATGSANREPVAVRDATERIWLLWSRRGQVGGAEDSWSLRMRVFDPGTSVWSVEAEVTPLLAGASDGEPSALLRPDGTLHVVFRSTRSGGRDLWALTIDPATSAISPPAAVLTGPMFHGWPALLAVPGGEPWLLYRSDQSVPRSSVGTRVPRSPDLRVTSAARPPAWDSRWSRRSQDTGTLTRQAGAITVVRTHIDRTARRRRWDDLLSYTPQKPTGAPGEPLLQDQELYTRGTIGLFLSQILPDSPLTQERVERLRPLLRKFLPIQTRAVVVIAPAVDIENVYTPGADIGEAYLDEYPDIEHYTGLDDASSDALAGWEVLLSTTAGHVSADPLDLTTLRRRTFFRPFE
ncbi:MAG TPA: hypothetical protein VIM73_01525, partial [Polyangiaceae bacterium]